MVLNVMEELDTHLAAGIRETIVAGMADMAFLDMKTL